ncbi:hypothetical protein DFH06DRAFT_1147346 [Mycena polygramma]|nr:hypothetical protein DFH06DRAFT_1147346 [Mycena polygramma]
MRCARAVKVWNPYHCSHIELIPTGDSARERVAEGPFAIPSHDLSRYNLNDRNRLYFKTSRGFAAVRIIPPVPYSIVQTDSTLPSKFCAETTYRRPASGISTLPFFQNFLAAGRHTLVYTLIAPCPSVGFDGYRAGIVTEAPHSGADVERGFPAGKSPLPSAMHRVPPSVPLTGVGSVSRRRRAAAPTSTLYLCFPRAAFRAWHAATTPAMHRRRRRGSTFGVILGAGRRRAAALVYLSPSSERDLNQVRLRVPEVQIRFFSFRRATLLVDAQASMRLFLALFSVEFLPAAPREVPLSHFQTPPIFAAAGAH